MRISDWSSDVCSSDLLKAAGIGNLPCMIPLKNRDGSTRADPARPTLADGAVRHVGDPVAFVVAETQVQARDAAELIEVDYDALPAAAHLATAMDAGDRKSTRLNSSH